MIALENLRFAYGVRVALDGVSFALKAGTFCAMTGRNGAGKSTALKLMSGELLPASGAVRWEGIPLARVDARALARRRGVLPQRSSLSFPFSIEEVVRLGRLPHARTGDPARDDAAVRAALAQTGFSESDFRRSYLELSEGERQRVHFARVLAQVSGGDTPAALLLDEPISSLDLAQRHAVLALARDFAKRGNLVFAVLHDLNLAAAYASRILMLHEGRLFADGAPRDVFTPQTIQTVFGVRAQVDIAGGVPRIYTEGVA